MVGDFDDHMISSVQNFRPLGAVEAYNSYNGVASELVREGGTFCVLSRVASQLKNYSKNLTLSKIEKDISFFSNFLTSTELIFMVW